MSCNVTESYVSMSCSVDGCNAV